MENPLSRSAISKMYAAIIAIIIIVAAIAGAYYFITQTGVSPTPTTEVVFKAQMYDEPTSIDPATQKTGPDWTAVQNMYDPLIFPSPNGSVQPYLATSWEFSADGLNYTFHLRHDVKFHDGTNLDASDVKRTMDRLLTLKTGPSYLWLGEFGINATTVVDNYTVTFILKNRFAPFLYTLYAFYPINMDLIENNIESGDYGKWGDYGKSYLLNHDAGTGPFKLVEWRRGTQLAMERFADYWQGWPKPNMINKLYLIFVRETATTKAMLLAGQLDYAGAAGGGSEFPAEMVQEMENTPHFAVDYTTFDYNDQCNLNTQKPPMDNVHLRKAMAYAFDYQTFVNQIYRGKAQIATGAVSPMHVGFNSSYPQGEFDLTKASEELSLSGLTGVQVDIMILAGFEWEESAALMWQSDLSKIGITMNIHSEVTSRFVELLTKPDTAYHGCIIGYGTEYPHIDGDLWSYQPSMWGNWFAGSFYNNTAFTQTLLSARADPNPDTSMQLYQRARWLLQQDQPTVWFVNPVWNPIHWDYVHGTARMPFARSDFIFWNVTIDK